MLLTSRQESSMGRRGYPPEFRRRVLDLIESGRKIADVARDLDVSAQTICTWRRQDRIDCGLEPGTTSVEQAALTAANKRIRELETELEIARRSLELLKEPPHPKRGSRPIEVMAAAGLPVQVACRVMQVSESGYYAALKAAPSERTVRHAWLTDVIRQVHADSRETYGSRRVHAELTLGHGLIVGYEQVALLMRRAGLQGLSGCPPRRSAPKLPTALDLVDGSSPATGATCSR
jgi:putative transposase